MGVGAPDTEPYIRPDSGQEVSQRADGIKSVISAHGELDAYTPPWGYPTSIGHIESMFSHVLSHAIDYLNRNPGKSLSFTGRTPTHRRLYDIFDKYMNGEGKRHEVHKKYKLHRSVLPKFIDGEIQPKYTLTKRRS